jgi:hypothetical protein
VSAGWDPAGNSLAYDPGRDEPPVDDWGVAPDNGYRELPPNDSNGVAEHEPPGRHERPPTSWRPVDLADAIKGHDIEPPTMLVRSDGLHLVYAGRTHWFIGEPESCKSWAAQLVVADEINGGHDVLYLDYEDDERGVVSRLLALGVDGDDIMRQLTYIRPDEPLADRYGKYTDGALDLFDTLKGSAFTLCVIDGVTESMTSEGMDVISNSDIARWMRLLPRRIANTGAAVVAVDHVVKAQEGQGRWAIGGQHKLAGLSGASYRFTTVRPLARATGSVPVEATVTVTVGKDRPGYVRGRCPEGKVGTLHLTAYGDGGVTAHLEPPDSEAEVDLALVGKVLGYLLDYDGVSQRNIADFIGGKAEKVRTACRWLVAEGWVRIEPKGRSHLHWLTPEGQTEATRGGGRTVPRDA